MTRVVFLINVLLIVFIDRPAVKSGGKLSTSTKTPNKALQPTPKSGAAEL